LKKALLFFHNRVAVPTSRPDKMLKVRSWTVKEQLEAVHTAGIGKSGLLLGESKALAKNRVRWRVLVDALCSPRVANGQ